MRLFLWNADEADGADLNGFFFAELIVAYSLQ
ncbi:MAG: hypothetical protein JWP12_3849 [Bacteroidetes bacterium]|nr:hypothetical protein [Bacteroidota bacterium]